MFGTPAALLQVFLGEFKCLDDRFSLLDQERRVVEQLVGVVELGNRRDSAASRGSRRRRQFVAACRALERRRRRFVGRVTNHHGVGELQVQGIKVVLLDVGQRFL